MCVKSQFPDAGVELCVFGCILAQTCGGSVKTSCSVLVVHANTQLEHHGLEALLGRAT